MGTSTDWRMTWVVDHMQRHLGDPLTVPELAVRVNLSPSRFRDLFSAHTGLGPVEYLQHLRLRRARLLIERTFLTLDEVMPLVGYKDSSQFCRDFRRYHGVSPSALGGSGTTTDLRVTNGAVEDPPIVRRPRQRRAREPGFHYA